MYKYPNNWNKNYNSVYNFKTISKTKYVEYNKIGEITIVILSNSLTMF